MPFLHDRTQKEKLQKLESELQDLTDVRQTFENDWISTCNLSSEAGKEKLKQVRETPPKNSILKIIHDAHKREMLKKDQVDHTNRELQSVRQEKQTKHDALEGLIARKDNEEGKVTEPT